MNASLVTPPPPPPQHPYVKNTLSLSLSKLFFFEMFTGTIVVAEKRELCTSEVRTILRRWTWTGDFKYREVKTGFCRNRSLQTGSSGTLIGWTSGQTTFVPLCDWMEGAWLRTLKSEIREFMHSSQREESRVHFLPFFHLRERGVCRWLQLAQLAKGKKSRP
jgi:hypothetical protein